MRDSIKNKILDLAKVAERSEKALKSISRAATNASKLSNSALNGGIGGVLCATAMFGGLAATSLVYAPFLVPAAAAFGILAGVRLGRDRVDAANERVENLTDRAWEMRGRELQGLNEQLKVARRNNAPGLTALEYRITELMTATPDELIRYYGLVTRVSFPTAQQDRPLLRYEQKALPTPGNSGSSLSPQDQTINEESSDRN